MSETIVIRPATKEDAPVIHDMVVALARDTGKMALVTSSVEDIARATALARLLPLRR
ncbi:MAG: hypothetical protein R3C55_12355 [Parvularculaceae bacterium]